VTFEYKTKQATSTPIASIALLSIVNSSCLLLRNCVARNHVQRLSTFVGCIGSYDGLLVSSYRHAPDQRGSTRPAPTGKRQISRDFAVQMKASCGPTGENITAIGTPATAASRCGKAAAGQNDS
jgi:hypothetical protein